MRKLVKRLYELDRSYDYGDAVGFRNTKQNVGFVKHRSHKRLRQQLKKFIWESGESLVIAHGSNVRWLSTYTENPV